MRGQGCTARNTHRVTQPTQYSIQMRHTNGPSKQRGMGRWHKGADDPAAREQTNSRVLVARTSQQIVPAARVSLVTAGGKSGICGRRKAVPKEAGSISPEGFAPSEGGSEPCEMPLGDQRGEDEVGGVWHGAVVVESDGGGGRGRSKRSHTRA
jgi:hypothetical protein